MTSGEAAYLAMSIACFVVFSVVLAWVSVSEARRAR